MAGGLSGIIHGIKIEIGKLANKIARGVATVALEDLGVAHESIISSYYDGYTPVDYYYYSTVKDGKVYSGWARGYDRSGNLGSIPPHPVGVYGSGANSYTAHFNVDGSGMPAYINSTGREFPGTVVFDMVWNQGIRGLPSGYRGHIGDVSISASPVGIGISGKPDEAMESFLDQWGFIRGGPIADSIAGG